MNFPYNCYGVNCSNWIMIHPRATIDMLGYIPSFVFDSDPRSAALQIGERYVWGGWRPQSEWARIGKPEDYRMQYPGDPVFPPLAKRELRDEVIVMYPSAYVGIFQKDGSFEMARVD